MEGAECTDRTLFLVLFGFYVAWMMGIAAVAYNKLKGSTDYATHFVGRKDYGVFVMGLTIFASAVSGNSVANNPNTSAGLGYMSFWILQLYTLINMSFSHLFPRMRRLSVERKWNSFSDILSDRYSSRPLIYFTLVFPLCSLTGYVVAQLWAFRELLPVVSAGYIAKNPVTIIITCVIYVCESFGGFDAVSYTDVVQGLIIIFALMIGPCWMTGKFGPLQGTVEYGCAATYYETIPDGNTTKERARGCYAYVSPWNSVHPAGKTYSYWFKPIWPTYGVDGSYWFNNTCWIGTANYILFYAFPIFPHVVQRVFAARSDESCKRSMLFMAVCMVLAGTPGIMLGFFYAINLKPVYPASTPAFGAILDFMMRDGGISEFSGVMSACGALAAIMSTIDSATLAGTNIITKELIVNGLAKLNPQLVEPNVMTIIERGTSGLILGIGMFFVCHHIPILVENDPLEATLMMNRIGFYQFGFITQAFPTTASALFFPKQRVFPLLIGTSSSLIILPVLSVSLWEVKGYATPKPEILDGTPNLYLHPSNVSLFCNWGTAMILNAILPEKIAMLTSQSGHALMTPEQMKEIMVGTVEVIYNPLGLACSVTLVLLLFFSLPWFSEVYDGCNIETFGAYNDWAVHKKKDAKQPADCAPQKGVGGFAPFGMVLFIATLTDFCLDFIMFSTWKPRPGLADATTSDAGMEKQMSPPK